MRFWYLLRESEPRSGSHNMAVDQHLLTLIEEGVLTAPVLRLYGWARPTLSLGYHQDWAAVARPDALQEHGVDLVRRWTGGRAVLHDHDEITYAVIAPQSSPFAGKVSHNYALIGEALRRFTDLGSVQGEVTREEESLASVKRMKHAPCFASLSRSEIEKGGRKLIGSAQKLGKKGFLQHGSIPLVHRPEILETITGTKLKMDRLMTSLADHYAEAGLNLPNREALMTRLEHAFGAAFQVVLRPLAEEGWPDESAVARIAADRFDGDRWTFRK